MPEPVDQRLTKLRVLKLEETPRAKLLSMRWLYYGQRQDDHCALDWEGYERRSGEPFLEWRQRGLVRATNATIPWGNRRPTCHTMIVGQVVDHYTSLLLGVGRQPTVRVIGDDESTSAIEAIFAYAGFWPVLAEGRKLGGAMGAFAILPEVRKGKLSLRTIRPEHTYIEWTDDAQWIPEICIEQKKVTIEQLNKHGEVECVEVWRTRAWDETFAYAYHDVPVEGQSDPDPSATSDASPRPIDVELDGDPIEHRAGRCPVIWIQNTTDTDNPIGDPDCEPVFEQVHQLDRSMSMVMRGSRANNDPTLVIKDTRAGLRQWTRREKGYGKCIEVTEKGDVELLETSGEAVKQSWDSIAALEARVERRTGVVSPSPENAGAYQSGVALQILHRTQTSRAGERRNPLGVGIKQLAHVVHTVVGELGIRDVGSEKEGVELPPNEIKETGEDGEVVTKISPHTLGDGGAISVTWGALHEPIPAELQTMADALGKMNGGRPVLSQETSVAYACSAAQTDTDPATELERIRKEQEAKVAEFDEALMPDVEGDGEDLVNGEASVNGTVDQVQHEAMNGIQVKTMGDTVVRAGEDLAPEAAEYVLGEGFPATDPARTKDAIAKQMAFAVKKRADAPEPPMVPGQAPAAAKVEDVPEPREDEKTGETE